MADGLDWSVESIPDGAETYMRAHRMFFRGNTLQPGVFRVREGGMSVNWEKYCTPEKTREQCKQPSDNAVVCLTSDGIRSIELLDVVHSPDATTIPPNRAHSDVIGIPDSAEDLTQVRALLLDISEIVLSL
jgi:hypothetical protein